MQSDEEIQRSQDAQRVDNARRAQANRLRASAAGQEMTEAQKAAQKAAQSANQSGGGAPQRIQPIVKQAVTGRNDLCPCGSGKKYKHCHGAN